MALSEVKATPTNRQGAGVQSDQALATVRYLVHEEQHCEFVGD